MRFALVCDTLPPSTRSGQAAILYRLLAGLDPSSYCLISEENYESEPYRTAANRLPGTYCCVPARFGACAARKTAPSGLRRWEGGARQLASMAWRAKEIAAIVKRERCEKVVAVSEPLTDLPAGYLASRLSRLPFYCYLFDDYSTKWVGAKARLFARIAEPRLLKSAAGIIAPNEFLVDELERRYGIAVTLIPNACDLSVYEQGRASVPDYDNSELRIVYTGAVYDAHFDALRNLGTATTMLESRSAKVHLYTPTPFQYLSRAGIDGPVVYHGLAPMSMMPRIQMEAHVLFLPLAFDSPYPEVIRTSAPAKMGEYLAARRPILVHAPRGSFVSTYFRRHGCGLVVDQNDPAALARAIEHLARDPATRERLSARAWERARADFDLERARTSFAELLGVGRGSRDSRP